MTDEQNNEPDVQAAVDDVGVDDGPGDVSPRMVRGNEARCEPLYPTARLIKGAVFEAEDLRRAAEDLKSRTETDMAELRERTETEAQARLKEAYELGLREGRDEFHELLTESRKAFAAFTRHLEENLKKEAIQLAGRIIDIEFERVPDHLAKLIRQGVDEVMQRFPASVLIHLHPDDFDLVKSREDEISEGVPDHTNFSLVRDTGLQRHDIVIETDMGFYDVGLNSRLRLMEQQGE